MQRFCDLEAPCLEYQQEKAAMVVARRRKSVMKLSHLVQDVLDLDCSASVQVSKGTSLRRKPYSNLNAEMVREQSQVMTLFQLLSCPVQTVPWTS